MARVWSVLLCGLSVGPDSGVSEIRFSVESGKKPTSMPPFPPYETTKTLGTGLRSRQGPWEA